MTRTQRLWRRARWSSVIAAASLLGCIAPSVGVQIATPLPPTVAPINGWETIAPGVERRIYQPAQNALASLIALRIDPALYTFRAHYQPGAPLTLTGWQQALPGAVAFINANFFDPQFNILGLLVADGAAYGQTFVNQGGMFQVQNGIARVRSLVREPYYGEPLEQAVQAFPMLVIDGMAAYGNPRGDRVARRTVAGQDAYGRIVLLVTPVFGMTLVELSAYLPTTDLGLVSAVNLDGGGSSMMYAGGNAYNVVSFDAVPAVLAVYPR